MTYRRTWRKNERKRTILAALARARGPMTYAMVAGAVGIYPIRQVARDLQRYVSFGYVRRWKDAGKFRYEITRRGRERLEFFNRRTPEHQKGTGGAPEVKHDLKHICLTSDVSPNAPTFFRCSGVLCHIKARL